MDKQISLVVKREYRGCYSTNLTVKQEDYKEDVQITISENNKNNWLITGIREPFKSKKDAIQLLKRILHTRESYNGLSFKIKQNDCNRKKLKKGS